MRDFSVAAVGDNTIDVYVGDESETYTGGNAFNVATQLAVRDRAVAYFGAIGDDHNGLLIARGLEAAGVETIGLERRHGDTAVTRIRVTAGERAFESEHFGVTAEYFPSTSDLAILATAQWIHIGMLPRATELRRQLAVLPAGSRPLISQDCAVSHGFDGLDVAFGSLGASGDARSWAREALAGGARTAVVTRGAAGALATDGRRWVEQPALPAAVVDTTGAGDAFIAGYIDATLRGAELAEAMHEGAAWAAATCGYRGGWPSARVSAEPG